MRIVIFAMALSAAACAGQPTAPPTRYIARASQAAPTTSAETTGDKIDPQAVLDAKRLGYTVVNENGETLFCHKDARTGSHLATETTCLTERQITDLREQTQRALQTFQMQMPPPQGK